MGLYSGQKDSLSRLAFCGGKFLCGSVLNACATGHSATKGQINETGVEQQPPQTEMESRLCQPAGF